MNDPTNRPLAELLADLEISTAQLAAGELVSSDEILAEEQAALAWLEAKERPGQRREGMPRR